jgi:hypothetical protein
MGNVPDKVVQFAKKNRGPPSVFLYERHMSKVKSALSIAAEERRILVVREGGIDVLPLRRCRFESSHGGETGANR